MLFLQLSLLVFYITRSLLFVQKVDHFGPFPSAKKFVTRIQNNYHQPVTLFDWIRRCTPFNPYKVSGDLWIINERRMEVWTCPFCLSFWTALIATAAYWVIAQPDLLTLISIHFAFASMSAILNYLVDYVQLRTNET